MKKEKKRRVDIKRLKEILSSKNGDTHIYREDERRAAAAMIKRSK